MSIKDNGSYVIGIIIPILFCVSLISYFSSFETVKELPRLNLEDHKPKDSENKIPSLWSKVKEKNKAESLLITLINFSQNSSGEEGYEEEGEEGSKLYPIKDLYDMNVKLAGYLRSFKDKKKIFYFPKIEKKSSVDMSDVKINGIAWGRAIIKGHGMKGVGDTIKDGKAKIIKIKKNEVIFSVEGEKVTIKIK